MRDLSICGERSLGHIENTSYARFLLLGFGGRAQAMARGKQAAVSSRRKPTQARARRTIETIFEATARIIERDGAKAVNTNLIAERAGIGIGTLYEYFPNKEAVLIAMARAVSSRRMKRSSETSCPRRSNARMRRSRAR
jgi:AcrR family transcriptional regulator